MHLTTAIDAEIRVIIFLILKFNYVIILYSSAAILEIDDDMKYNCPDVLLRLIDTAELTMSPIAAKHLQKLKL